MLAEHEAFEAKWTMPASCTWTGAGYAATEYNAWLADSHADRWEGWQARAARAQQGAAQHARDTDVAIDVMERTAIARTIYAQVRNEYYGRLPLPPWSALDADTMQRIVDSVKLTTAQQQSGHGAPMTDEQIALAFRKGIGQWMTPGTAFAAGIRSAERAHGITEATEAERANVQSTGRPL
jgi:hypothetical protein